MFRKYLISSAIVAGCMGLAPTTYADIHVMPGVRFIRADKGMSDFTVVNDSKTDKAYITVSLMKVEHPGTSREKQVQFTKKETPQKFGMAFSPQKFVLSPEGQRNVRIIPFKRDKTQDLVYIARVVSHKGLQSFSKVNSKMAGGVTIQVGYGVRIIVTPPNPKPDLVLRRKVGPLALRIKGIPMW